MSAVNPNSNLNFSDEQINLGQKPIFSDKHSEERIEGAGRKRKIVVHEQHANRGVQVVHATWHKLLAGMTDKININFPDKHSISKKELTYFLYKTGFLDRKMDSREACNKLITKFIEVRSEEHTSELQSQR